MWLGSSVVECSHGKQETLVSSSVESTFSFHSLTFGGSVWVHARAASVTGRHVAR